MSDKKHSPAKQKPEHEVHSGVVTASIFVRQSNCGYRYETFELKRRFENATTGKEARAASFFDKNEADLIEAVRQACDWIRRKTAPAKPDGPPVPAKEETD